jgi:hypothetical protein
MLAPTENVAAFESAVMPARNAFENPPMKGEPPVKVRL